MALCWWFIATVLVVHVTCDHLAPHKHKRQIFREQVSPHVGGKIPEDAFRTDRLALNRLNKEGIAIPDGVLLEARHRESHHSSHRHDPAISASIVKLVQHPNGRYAPPEGHYPFENLIESTYIIRPPWGHAQSLIIPPHKTLEVPLTIPHKPLYSPDSGLGHGLSIGEEDLLTFANQLDGFYPDLPGTKIWTGFGQLFHETPARFLRQTKGHSQELKVSAPAKPQGQYPRLTAIPATSFTCGAVKGKMVADPETNCQVFHLCHTTGQMETFLCPQGMRYDAARSQCMQWTKVTCGRER